jgi:hypothetical protein
MQLRNLVALLLAAALLAACNINVQAPRPQTDQNAIETMVEQTLQAVVVTPSESPVLPASATPPAGPGSATPSASPSPTATSTKPGDKPMLEITGNSNCRSGPGASFKNVTAFTPGAKLEIVGKNIENNYWQVKLPNSEETCWVWGVYTTTTGNVESVKETTPAVPTALALAPSQPGPLYYTYECTGSTIGISLKWSDRADNETGYRVYRGTSIVADLSAGASSYDDTVMLAPPQTLQYSVVAYNDNGESSPSRQSFTACP